MRTVLLKISFLACLYFIFGYNSLQALDSPSEKSIVRKNFSETKKNPTHFDSSKKVRKLTFKEKFKIIKQLRNERKKARKMGVKNDAPMVLLYILAILLPPVAVGIYTDWDAKNTLINLILTLIFWLPGIVHAFYILLS